MLERRKLDERQANFILKYTPQLRFCITLDG
jgi:hypothetical protein